MFERSKPYSLYPSQCNLGESPVWHPIRKSCLWVDIEKGLLYEYRWHDNTIAFWTFDCKVTVVLPCLKKDEFILGLNAGIARFNILTKELNWLTDIETHLPNSRCNDASCDNHGRLWIGTLEMNLKEGAGSLYFVDQDLQVQKKIDNVTISNGIAWSLDNTHLYYIDSFTGYIQSYIFNAENGDLYFDRNIIYIPKELGSPDGMTIDEEGMLWIAQYGGHGIYRWNPGNGDLLEKINIPAPNVTSCAFVGDKLNYLLITTAREGLSKDCLDKYPQSGDTFCVKTDVHGIAPNYCIL